MSYIESHLVEGEEVLLRPRYHWVRFLPAVLFVALGLALAIASAVLPQAATPLWITGGALVVVGLVGMAFRAVKDSFDEFAVTSMRVIRKTGLLTRRVIQIPNDKVQDLRLVATLWGRWLSYGDVELESAGEEGPLVFPRIQNPENFRNVLFTWRQRHPAGAFLTAAPASPRASVEERLREAERLRASGAITEDEYKAKRQELIKEL